MENTYIIERMKREIGDQFLEESDVLTLGDTIKLFKIMMEEKNDK